jgi:hypothetical protein
MDNSEVKYMYRYEFDYAETSCGNYSKLKLEMYTIIKETPKGFWIQSLQDSGNHNIFEKKFVLSNSKKAFAYTIEEKALLNFIHRKNKYIEILNKKIHICDEALRIANDLMLEKFKKEIKLKWRDLLYDIDNYKLSK